MKKRTLLKNFITAGTLAQFPALASASLSGFGNIAPVIPQALSTVIVVADDRYNDARLFAEHLYDKGASAFTMSGDALRLWYQQLHPRLYEQNIKNVQASICGLTTGADFVLLHQCLNDIGFSLTAKIVHDGRGQRVIEHRLPRFVGSYGTSSIKKLSDDWAIGVADLLADNVATKKTITELQGLTTLTTSRGKDFPGSLVSWSFS